jgi:protocatechuate 3,4-dioxygenase, beta subunit
LDELTEQSTPDLILPSYPREQVGVDPPLDYEGYGSTELRHPLNPLVVLPQMLTEVTGPVLGEGRVGPTDHDLTVQHEGEPIGQRIQVSGRLLDSDGRAIPNALVEVWQANASGRYKHGNDDWPAPLDPNFTGAGRCVTDDQGRYTFTTIKPGPYPWGNHHNAWRPAHIHFSLLGRAFAQRLVTQMYFPGDPFFAYDPIFNSVRDPRARERMIAQFRIHETVPNWAQAYEFDLFLRGPAAAVFEEAG